LKSTRYVRQKDQKKTSLDGQQLKGEVVIGESSLYQVPVYLRGNDGMNPSLYTLRDRKTGHE
jgi:hypothetical protein